LATEIEQIRNGLVSSANATYLDRPVLGGVTAGAIAYQKDAAGVLTYVPAPTTSQGVLRTVGDGATVRVDLEGPDAFGPDGASMFDHLSDLVTALRANNMAAVTTATVDLDVDSKRLINSMADIGSRTNRVEYALTAAKE